MTIIFDLDGTLFETRKTLLSAVSCLFRELGLSEPNEASIMVHVGKPMQRFLAAILPEEHVNNDVESRLRVLEREAVTADGQLFAGIRETLHLLHNAGHKLLICSNGNEAYIKLVLAVTNIEQLIDGVHSAKSYSSKAEKVRELLDLSPVIDAVMIGDTAEDIAAGTENNIPTIAALYGYGGLHSFDGSLAAESPSELLPCIRWLGIYNEINCRLVSQGRKSIGICGVDTAGKTVMTKGFARYLQSIGLKCMVVHLDDFHNPLKVRRQGTDEKEAYYTHAFNIRQLIDEVLIPLKDTGEIDKEVSCLNLDTDQYENRRQYRADKYTIVLIEGVLLFRPPILDFLDGTVFLDITFEEVLHRARIRDVPKYGEAFLDKYRDKYIPVQKRFIEEFKPKETCDILIDNNDLSSPKIVK